MQYHEKERNERRVKVVSKYKDYAVKARLNNFDEVEKILISINAVFVGVDSQIDYYFETDKGKLKYRKGTIENLITHYKRTLKDGFEKTTVYRYESNPTIKKIEELRKKKRQIGVTHKERRIYTIDNVKIHLDKLEDGQRFIEIEAMDFKNEFTDYDLINQCMTMKSKLHIQDNDLVKTGYLRE
ncbi:MAG: CYTH domain-containing protein [Cyclobacteriaceae bacterium]|nr:CYTH domain-containing protein [Cyclobacteriaceae bacterium]